MLRVLSNEATRTFPRSSIPILTARKESPYGLSTCCLPSTISLFSFSPICVLLALIMSTSTTPTNARAGPLRSLLKQQRFVSELDLATLAATQEYTNTIDGLLTRLKQDIASEGLKDDPVAKWVETVSLTTGH